MNLAVIVNSKQAEAFCTEAPSVSQVVSFCPNATQTLKSAGYRVISTVTMYGALSHARVVVAADRDMRRIMEVANVQYGLSDLESKSLATLAHNFLLCIYHLHYALRCLSHDNTSFMWMDGNKLAQGNYGQMFESLAGRVGPDILSYANTNYSPAHYLLTLAYNAIISFGLRRSTRTKIIDYGDALPGRIIRAAIAGGEPVLAINTHRVCKNALQSTRLFIKSVRRLLVADAQGRPVQLFRTVWPGYYRAHVVPFAVPKLLSPAVERAVKRLIEQAVPFMRTDVAMGRKLVRKCRPHIAVSEHALYPHVLSGLEELKRRGGRHAMINHATHTVQHGPISKLATLSWGSQQHIITPYTTDALPKSPLVAALYPEVRADKNYTVHHINVYGRIGDQTSAEGPFMLLHAGNYTDPFHHVPWCKETADEYLQGIQEMIEEVGKMQGVELVIKLKNKKSTTHKVVLEEHIRRLGVGGHIRVDTTGNFTEMMSRAHLVVCNLSGTIEEALANHIPIMLQSYRKNYFHIDEQTVANSTINGLAPAYLVKERTDIARIITSLSARRTELRNPALFAKVAWQENQLTSIKDFAKALVKSAVKNKVAL